MIFAPASEFYLCDSENFVDGLFPALVFTINLHKKDYLNFAKW